MASLLTSGIFLTLTPILANPFFNSNPTSKNFEAAHRFAWDPLRNWKKWPYAAVPGCFDVLPLPY